MPSAAGASLPFLLRGNLDRESHLFAAADIDSLFRLAVDEPHGPIHGGDAEIPPDPARIRRGQDALGHADSVYVVLELRKAVHQAVAAEAPLRYAIGPSHADREPVAAVEDVADKCRGGCQV